MPMKKTSVELSSNQTDTWTQTGRQGIAVVKNPEEYTMHIRQVFGQGFTVPVLRELADSMERQHHLEGTTVLRKGATAHKVEKYCTWYSSARRASSLIDRFCLSTHRIWGEIGLPSSEIQSSFPCFPHSEFM